MLCEHSCSAICAVVFSFCSLKHQCISDSAERLFVSVSGLGVIAFHYIAPWLREGKEINIARIRRTQNCQLQCCAPVRHRTPNSPAGTVRTE